jgi:hypothetical protein
VPFGKFDFTAGNQDVAIDSITLKREGLSNRSDIRRIYFERNGIRVSNRTSITMDDTAVVTFTPSLVINAGSTETLDLIVELAEGGATVGAEHDFAITEVSGVSAQGLPVKTALMRIGSYAVPTVTIDAVRTQTTYNVGQENALISEFRIENS